MRFRDMTKTTSRCPTQFEGWTDDDRPVYVRFRHGVLSLEVGRRGDPASAVPCGGYEIYEEDVDTDYDGEISWAEVELALAGVDLDEALAARQAEESRREQAWAPLVDEVITHHLSHLAVYFLGLERAPWPEGAPYSGGAFAFLDFVAARVGPGLVVVTWPEDGGWMAHLLVHDVALNAIAFASGVAARVGGGPLSGGEGRAFFALPEPTVVRDAVLGELARL
ncbi:MAG: hypothetical protein Q8P18_02670 [Pseudomonadota bacterium]|nr:hypothetical protein [Pseudomonadota bacterium]